MPEVDEITFLWNTLLMAEPPDVGAHHFELKSYARNACRVAKKFTMDDSFASLYLPRP